MFETFNVPAFYLSNQPVLSLYSAGRTTGIICEFGYGVTSTSPIYEGFSIPHAVAKLQIGGNELTLFL
jgi:actin beta/gamma 1